jgi:hypothetical protein
MVGPQARGSIGGATYPPFRKVLAYSSSWKRPGLGFFGVRCNGGGEIVTNRYMHSSLSESRVQQAGTGKY